jgi:hypothetical protein
VFFFAFHLSLIRPHGKRDGFAHYGHIGQEVVAAAADAYSGACQLTAFL